ncbi:hypothetical protein M501DRAFT_53695 [Patellaria atrata CBS 101060]|uniref:Uncharacterized protein n=1 Tax=Patellaria atrata CBS 101060 TaxID=1346257 RepID=A0A9P4VRK0_9PEZI|nr:hypothetical protein M501DRAFT_53695 [Patellaria atrata CBS 101060]
MNTCTIPQLFDHLTVEDKIFSKMSSSRSTNLFASTDSQIGQIDNLARFAKTLPLKKSLPEYILSYLDNLDNFLNRQQGKGEAMAMKFDTLKTRGLALKYVLEILHRRNIHPRKNLSEETGMNCTRLYWASIALKGALLAIGTADGKEYGKHGEWIHGEGWVKATDAQKRRLIIEVREMKRVLKKITGKSWCIIEELKIGRTE